MTIFPPQIMHSTLIDPFFEAVLPVPPGINHSYKIVRIGQHHRLAATPALEQFKRDALTCLSAVQTDWQIIEQIRTNNTPLAVSIKFCFPDARRRDVDGGIKAVLDAVFQVLIVDDKLVHELQASKCIDRADPRVEVKVYLLQG